MLNPFDVKQLETRLVDWIGKLNHESIETELIHGALSLKMNDYQNAILKSFRSAFYKRIPETERERLLQEAAELGVDQFVQSEFERTNRLKSYGPLNALAVLRVFYRKIVELQREFSQQKEVIRKLFAELKEIDMKARELTKQGRSDDLFNIQTNILALQNKTKELIDLALEDDQDYMFNIHSLFLNGETIKRDDLLQVITLKKKGKYWDGVHFEKFSEQYASIPEEIDLETFENLIFIEKIEHPDDCYLCDIFMDHMFKMMDQYEEETGTKAINPFELLEQITGKPLQTYTADFDEYGDVVSLTPNKPTLKLISTNKAVQEDH